MEGANRWCRSVEGVDRILILIRCLREVVSIDFARPVFSLRKIVQSVDSYNINILF